MNRGPVGHPLGGPLATPRGGLRRGLYAIADADACELRGFDLLGVARALLAAHPTVLQLRAKDRPAGQVLTWLEALREPCREAGALLFANDRADLAEAAGCDGVHVGQEDLPVVDVKRAFPHLRVGVSTHNPEQFRAALSDEPDYVALGPIFETGSKRRPDPVVGTDLLVQLTELAEERKIPVVAIGGVGLEQVAEVVPPATCVAAISALLPAAGKRLDQVTLSAQQLAACIRARDG